MIFQKLVIFFKIIFIITFIFVFNTTSNSIHLFNNNYKSIYPINNLYNNSSSIYENCSFEYFTNFNKEIIYLNLINIKYNYSYKFNLVKIGFYIEFLDKNNHLILPSDLTLYNNINIICYIQIINKNISINSLPNIYLNNHFECLEYFEINEKIEIGIKIMENSELKKIHNFLLVFPKHFFNYKKLDDKNFEFLYLAKEYINIIKKIKDLKKNETFRIKKLYLQFPISSLKRDIAIASNKWYFKKIYTNYFCFCKGYDFKNNNNFQSCKYSLYLNIIDSNRKVYKKDHYLFLDFILEKYNMDDVFPLFKQMSEQKYNTHYLTGKKELYNEYCFQKEKCLTIIYANNYNYTINGNFLEKYLTLLLKLKCVVSGGGININYINNIFYNIEYIKYICVGHGVSFFKYFLYGAYDWYGHKVYDKLLLPPSEKLISVARNNGWNDDNIIKINLPRWDKYNCKIFYFSDNKEKISNNSIFIMFTWRKLKKNKFISKAYFKNILNLINNKLLNFALKNKNIILYFSLHHKLSHYKNIFLKNKYIHFLQENTISDCLSKTNLLVTDFSSIIFDMIYRKKPYIIYIPDANDPEIEYSYNYNYYKLIQFLKNGTIAFENKYFNLKEAINKILYYINNDYTLESKIDKFYESFEFKKGNNTNLLIKYITKII